ncbi:uncharacterized protein BBA_09048 [Beauveria bassiana ARSEF 2860]|uniref:Uncharacterized protein n=1 Tax=Beauveria bassiana (strain ARSEF 2860) TaxID=655819 RepID=J4VTY6_BEAB2|nr:uncharacterized protein BBA_09048 [Beauveria bassiana ARSEF 2860]EJP62000.1 hypothetical protein BBA_09048 [Beauveria bassiana ARSEF 2860]
MTKPEAMDEDDEEPAGEQNVKKESEEGSMFVSPINNDQDNSPEKGKGSPSDPKPSSDKEQYPKPSSDKEQDPKPSSDKEQDPTPSSNNDHDKPPPPRVGFQNGLAKPSTEAEDELDLVRANPVRSLFHGGASENVGWSRLALKRHNDVIETESLEDLSYGIKKQRNGGKLYQCGDIVSVRGFAWQPLKNIDHYSSLAPRNWKQGNRTVRPPMRIMVKWTGKAETEDEGREVTRWEKRDAVWRCWEDERGHGGATVQCEED